MDAVNSKELRTFSISSNAHDSIKKGIVFGRQLQQIPPLITITGADISASQITDVDHFLPHHKMKRISYLHSENLDKRIVTKRIKQIRKGRNSLNPYNKGLIYWEHMQAQQCALDKLANIFEKSHIEVVLNMERGGTLLYDFLASHSPERIKPKIAITTAKELTLSSAQHIGKTIAEMKKLSELGYKSFALVEVSISGVQLFKILKDLDTEFCNDYADVHVLILKQSLTIRDDSVGKGINEKVNKILNKNSWIHLSIVTTPLIIGEDVHEHLCYGSQNNYPVNLILPDETIWQFKSEAGTRETLKRLMSGQLNPMISSLPMA